MKKCLESKTDETERKTQSKNNNDNDNDNGDIIIIDKNNKNKDPNYRKCCGTTKPSTLNIQCDKCEDFCHGECCGIHSADKIPSIWFCFECNGNWPKANILYERLAAVLHSVKKTSK
jgi:hypothetical protein